MVWPKYCSFDCSPKKWSKSIDGNQKKLFMIIVTVLLLLLELFFAKCKLHQQHLFIEVDFQVNKNKMKWLKMKRTLKYTINQKKKYHDWILDTFFRLPKEAPDMEWPFHIPLGPPHQTSGVYCFKFLLPISSHIYWRFHHAPYFLV